MTKRPDQRILYTPFPDYEREVPQSGPVIERVTYRLAGQIVAVRAAALNYVYTDHLGNVIGFGGLGGGFTAASLARYDPFGNFRTTPTTNPGTTARGFTGHMHNNTGTNSLGLIYMNARYYLPEVGRFASADSIVPDPGNPQSYNRYSYGFNNPVNFIDPSGRSPSDGCNYSEGCSWDSTPYGDSGGEYPYGQTVAVSYYYDPPGAPMHLYTSPDFGRRPANFVDQTYGGATNYVNYETDYLWMKFDVLRQHAKGAEIEALAAREARVTCNGGSGRCTIARVSMCLGAFAGPVALESAGAAGGISALAALIEGADSIVHNDGSNVVQMIITEFVGGAADGVLPGVGGPIVDGVDLVVDMGSLSTLEASYFDQAKESVVERLNGWRQMEGRYANEQRWGPTLPWINPTWP